MCAWLIPNTESAERAGALNSRGRLRFSASLLPDSQDKWVHYRLAPGDLVTRILSRLTDLDSCATPTADPRSLHLPQQTSPNAPAALGIPTRAGEVRVTEDHASGVRTGEYRPVAASDRGRQCRD
jgi:hypothetical protein